MLTFEDALPLDSLNGVQTMDAASTAFRTAQ